jgi:hypothetical protein
MVKKKLQKEYKNAGKFYKPVRDVLWNWEMSKTGNIHLFKSYHIGMKQKHGHDIEKTSDN